jgi:hypothetical protein
MSFTLLPTEIHPEIISLLDYETLKNFTLINQHFHQLGTRIHIHSALLNLEKGELRASHAEPTLFPCYGCFKLCPEGTMSVARHDRSVWLWATWNTDVVCL